MGMELDVDYLVHIRQFMQDYRLVLHEEVILKAHVLEVHVQQFFEKQEALGYGGKGLAFFTEQPFEAGHSFFDQLWKGGKYARELTHPDYDKQLLKAGIKFNSNNM